MLRFDRRFHGFIGARRIRAFRKPLFFLRNEIDHTPTFLRAFECEAVFGHTLKLCLESLYNNRLNPDIFGEAIRGCQHLNSRFNEIINPATPATITTKMAPNGNQTGKRMWPSLEMVTSVANVANFFFIASLVVGVVSTILIVWMTGVKEEYWEVSRRQLENSTQEAKLETERLKSLVNWREVDPATADSLISDLASLKGSVTLAYVQNDPEVVNFTILLQTALTRANDKRHGLVIGAQPRMYTDRNIFGLYIFGKDGQALKGVRDAFQKAGYVFSWDRVAPPVTQVGAMTTTIGEPGTDVVIMVGSRQPPSPPSIFASP